MVAHVFLGNLRLRRRREEKKKTWSPLRTRLERFSYFFEEEFDLFRLPVTDRVEREREGDRERERLFHSIEQSECLKVSDCTDAYSQSVGFASRVFWLNEAKFA